MFKNWLKILFETICWKCYALNYALNSKSFKLIELMCSLTKIINKIINWKTRIYLFQYIFGNLIDLLAFDCFELLSTLKTGLIQLIIIIWFLFSFFVMFLCFSSFLKAYPRIERLFSVLSSKWLSYDSAIGALLKWRDVEWGLEVP